jgi:hypothetical protein
MPGSSQRWLARNIAPSYCAVRPPVK